MDVYVNNAPFAGDRPTDGTLGQLIEQLTAEDSDQAICSLNLGRLPAKYGVHVAVVTMPICLNAFIILN